eukprot:gene5730-5668_t
MPPGVGGLQRSEALRLYRDIVRVTKTFFRDHPDE